MPPSPGRNVSDSAGDFETSLPVDSRRRGIGSGSAMPSPSVLEQRGAARPGLARPPTVDLLAPLERGRLREIGASFLLCTFFNCRVAHARGNALEPT
jgi:hypothetical protein